jgi:hypothetical protein
MFFEVFFIVALYGWREGLRLNGFRIKLGQFIFVGMVCLTTGIFLRSFEILIQKSLYAHVTSQLKLLFHGIPESVLIVICESHAGLNGQAAFQYVFGGDAPPDALRCESWSAIRTGDERVSCPANRHGEESVRLTRQACGFRRYPLPSSVIFV